MLAIRIIPCLDVQDGRVVKGTRFLNLKDAGDPIEQAIFYAEQGADELCFLDITASVDKRKIIKKLVTEIAEQVFIPFTVGGGISTMEDIDMILNAGADKVSINTAAFQNPQLLTEAANYFGSQCIVCAIDAKRNPYNLTHTPSSLQDYDYFEVFLHGGRTATSRDAIEWALEATHRGAGEILLTSIDFDGTRQGYDIELLRKVSNEVSVPVIASGGAGHPKHLIEVIKQADVNAVLAANIFHFREYSIWDIKQSMRHENIPVRLEEDI